MNGSGTENHPIIIQNATINSQETRSYAITTNSNNYLTLSHLSANNSNFQNIRIYTSSYIIIDNCSSSGKGAAIYSISSSHITISNFTSTNNINAYGGALSFNAPGTDLSISSSTISGSNSRAIYSALTSNITLNDVEATSNGAAAGIEIRNMTSDNLLLTNVYTGVTRGGVNVGNIGYGIYLNNDDGVLLNADGIYSKNNTDMGINFRGSSLIQGSILKNFNISNNNSHGIWVETTPNLTIQSGIASYNSATGIYIVGPSQLNLITGVTMNHNGGDGLVATTGVLGLIVKYSEASYNGTVGGSSSGDGFSIHDTCTGIFYYDKAIGNLNTGMAHVGTSSGSIYNSLIVSNGSPSDPDKNRAGLYLTTTANPGFTVENNIVSGNYPADIRESSTSYPYNNFDYNLYNPLDNNKFYTLNGVSFTSWANYHSTREIHSLNANPLFVDATNNIFSLQANSPAINAGTDVSLTPDYVGTTVPQGSAPDIGAYEYTNTVASNSTTTTTSSTSSPSAPVCNDTKPASSPNLFQIDVTDTSAKLFFAPAKDPVNKYFIAYSLNMNVLMYGVEYSQGYSNGVLSYTINLLKPNTTYYFKVRGGNGCITGDWSGNLGVKTTSSKFTNKSFYLWDILMKKVIL